MSEAPKFYFANFCFLIQKAGVQQFYSGPIQMDKAQITLPVLAGVKKSMGLPADAILISATPLGYMTLEEFSPPSRDGMKATDEYLAGLLAGQSDGIPANPYTIGTVQYKDWQSGHAKGLELYMMKANT